MTTPTPQLAPFIASINNVHQRQSLQKLLTPNENERIYIDRFELEPAAAFYVRGAMKPSGRETYKINLHQTGELTCSCMDFHLNNRKLNRVCKHICFIVCKYGKIYDAAYFNTPDPATPRRLAPHYREQLIQSGQQIVAAIANPADIDAVLRECLAATATSSTANTTQPQPQQAIFNNLDAYKGWDSDIECRICYTDVKKDNTTVVCPDCHHIMHRNCMRVWIVDNKHTTCVMCRSHIWQKFRIMR